MVSKDFDKLYTGFIVDNYCMFQCFFIFACEFSDYKNFKCVRYLWCGGFLKIPRNVLNVSVVYHRSWLWNKVWKNVWKILIMFYSTQCNNWYVTMPQYNLTNAVHHNQQCKNTSWSYNKLEFGKQMLHICF